MRKGINWKYLCILSAVATTALGGPTYKSGVVADETWTTNDSPVYINGDILVAKLSIQPGVQVVFQTNCTVEVAGVLVATGTAAEPVVFTRTNGDWQGIFFNQGPPGSLLSYCRISNSVNSGIRIAKTSVTLKNCVISNNTSKTGGGGIQISMDSEFTQIEDCILSQNTSAGSGGGLFAKVTSGNLVLRNCSILNNASGGHGGGIYLEGNGPGIEFTNCKFLNNWAQINGGGVSINVAAGNIRFQDSLVLNNSANKPQSSGCLQWRSGGGLFASLGAAELKIVNSEVSGNSVTAVHTGTYCDAYGAGGGLYLIGRTIINNSLLRSNVVQTQGEYATQRSYGGAIYHESGTLSVSNSVVAYNICSAASSVPDDPNNTTRQRFGGGLYVDSGKAILVNCTLAYNNPEAVVGKAGSEVRNCIAFFNNNGGPQITSINSIAYSDIQGGVAGVGNINFNPIFHSPTDLQLLSGSLCIDAGDPTEAYSDIAFPPSKGTSRNDMGVYGGPGAAWGLGPRIEDQDTDGLLDAWEIEHFGDTVSNSALSDPDEDGLSNSDEFTRKTNPTKADSDNDNFNDKTEIESGSDPLDSTSTPPPVLVITVEQIKLRFVTSKGTAYTIQASTDCKQWTSYEQLVGNGDIVTRTYGVTNNLRFFQVVKP